MGLELKIYEVTNHNDILIHDEHTLKEVLSLNGFEAFLVVEWFYNTKGRCLHDNIREKDFYIKSYGFELIELINILNKILQEKEDIKKNLLALNYFPTTNINSYYIIPVDIFSMEYYDSLVNIYNKLKEIIPSTSINNKERLFFYNVTW